MDVDVPGARLGEAARLLSCGHEEDERRTGLAVLVVAQPGRQAGDVAAPGLDPTLVRAHLVYDPVHLLELRQTHGGRQFAHTEVDPDDPRAVPGNEQIELLHGRRALVV